MTEYRVKVEKTVVETTYLDVSAASEEEAEEKAKDVAEHNVTDVAWDLEREEYEVVELDTLEEGIWIR